MMETDVQSHWLHRFATFVLRPPPYTHCVTERNASEENKEL